MEQTATATKRVRVVCSRPRKEVTVEVTPDDTASSMLEKAGLDGNDYIVLKPGDQADYQPSEPIWNDVVDGGKFHIVPDSEMGIGISMGQPRTYAEDEGWKPRSFSRGSIFRGFYRARGFRWHGQIQQFNEGQVLVLIKRPPIGFLRASQWAGCIHATQDPDWFLITFKPYAPAKDVDGAIAEVNRVLGICIRRTTKAVA